MSNLSYNQFSRLSDSLERDLMRQALSDGESVSIAALGKEILAAIQNGVKAAWNYAIEVTAALDEARANNARFSGSHW
ncbi:hypothetical protein H0A70_01675 [Alcaligenaceae bacterium]|nr:hypothetical protein [Alcaligenaceae bacterium]